MLQLLRHYRIEAWWLMLLVALTLLTPKRVESQRDSHCDFVEDTQDCDYPGYNCVCDGEGGFE